MWGWVREKRGSRNPAHPAVGRWGGEGQPGGGSSPRTGAPSRGEGGGGQWAAEGASPELEDGGRGFGPLVAASQRGHSPPPCEDMGPLFLRHWHFHRTVGAVRGLGVWGLSFDSVCCRRTLPASYLALWGPQSSMRLRKGTWGARAPWGKGSVLLGPCPTQDRDLWEELGVALSVPAGCSKEPTDLLLCRPPQKASTHGGWGLRELDHLSFLPSAPIHLECRETSWYFSFAVGWGVESVPPPLAWPLTVPQPRPAGRPGAQHSGWQPHRQLSPPLPLGGWRYACVRWSSFCFISGQPSLQVSA